MQRSYCTESIAAYFGGFNFNLWSVQEKERESWETASQALKMKLEIAESNCIRAEVELAKIRSTYLSFCGISYIHIKMDIYAFDIGQVSWNRRYLHKPGSSV